MRDGKKEFVYVRAQQRAAGGAQAPAQDGQLQAERGAAHGRGGRGTGLHRQPV